MEKSKSSGKKPKGKKPRDAPRTVFVEKSKSAKGKVPVSNKYSEYVEQYMVYYLIGDIHLRPALYVSGFFRQSIWTGLPYPLRRSSGHIQLVPYEPSSVSMSHDYNHVMEKGVAPASSKRLAFNVLNDARLAVFGEHSGGYIFEAPTALATTGLLHIAYWNQEDLLAEEPLKCGAVIDIVHGIAKLYVCDWKHFVLVYDSESKFKVGLLDGSVPPAVGNEGKAAASL